MSLVHERSEQVWHPISQRIYSRGCIPQILSSHEVGVRVVVHYRIVFIWSSHAVNTEFPTSSFRVETEITPEACGFDEHLDALIKQKFFVPGCIHVLSQRMHD